MTAREHINEYFNSGAFMVLSALALVTMAFVAVTMGLQPVAADNIGAFFVFKGNLSQPGPLSATINVLCLLTTGGLMLALNKVFTFVRSTTHLFASAFFLLQTANPHGLVSLNAGTLMCLMTAMVTLPLFASFQDRHAQRSIFLIFALASAGTMFHYGFLVLIPAFFLGFLNMGVLNLKGLLAMLFGLVTPFWIVLGLGIATPADLCPPPFHGIWSLNIQGRMSAVLVLAAVTAVLGIVLAVMNLMTIMNYRMQTRVYNAFFVFVLATTVVAICVDYNNVAAYLPLLGIMTAVQIAHFHTLRNSFQYRYIFIVLLIAGCIASGTINLIM